MHNIKKIVRVRSDPCGTQNQPAQSLVSAQLCFELTSGCYDNDNVHTLMFSR